MANTDQRTTVFIRDIEAIEDMTLLMENVATAEATVEKILSSAETKTPVVLWNGGESIQFVSPDIIMGPSDGFSSLNLDSIIKNEQQD